MKSQDDVDDAVRKVKRTEARVTRERWRLLVQIERLLDSPMVFLGFVWLALLIIELWTGLNPLLQLAVTGIWIVFILDFLVKLIIAPKKRSFSVATG